MAKRKRLTPTPTPAAGPAASSPPAALGAGLAPIAQVAGDAAAAAAFHDLAEEMTRAREEGRLLVSLPLEAVLADHMVRDRMAADADEMRALIDSLRARGQQTPIEVTAREDGRYGLISGWRRLTALRSLRAETGEARFATVQAILRQPDSRAAAYVAMVEENEIRADLSFYERARIVREGVRAGAFDTDQAALNTLFAAAPAARRSKIKAFVRVVDQLGAVLRHPVRLSEHLGLKLSKALSEDAGLPERIRAALAGLDPEDAEAEIAALQAVLTGGGAKRPSGTEPVSAKTGFRSLTQGLSLKHEGQSLTLKGKAVTPELVARIEAFLSDEA